MTSGGSFALVRFLKNIGEADLYVCFSVVLNG